MQLLVTCDVIQLLNICFLPLRAAYADATGQSRLETPRRGLSPSRARFAPLRFRFRRGTGHHPLVDESLEKIKGGAEAREHVDGETVTNKLCCSFMW